MKSKQDQKVKQDKARVKAKAIRDYKRGETLRAIAVRYGVSTGTVSLWAQGAGLERRQQGCRAKIFPNEADIQIVNAVKAVQNGKPTLAEIGHHWQMSRANVHRIYHRWKDWQPVVPFAVGDKIRFMGRDYEVKIPDVFRGIVRDLRTGVEQTLDWKKDDQVAVKL